MSDKPRWPAKSLFFADLISIVAGFVVFRALCTQWQPEAFARWEWLRVVLGLCLLLPRNGFEILAQRCAIRHPKHVREWTALNLVVRLPLSILAMIAFLAASRLTGGDSYDTAALLAMTLPLQAVVPDLSARIQGRFGVLTQLHMWRNMIPAIACLFLPHLVETPLRMAACLLLAEAVVFSFWWFDAIRHEGLPGGRWLRLLRRGWLPMALRTSDQTISRWMRVSSWNVDAILLGTLAPEFWARLAPARSLMMTAVFPFASYLGNASPLLARDKPDSIRRRFVQASVLAIATGAAAVLLSAAFAPAIASNLFGAGTTVDRETLVTIAARSGPIMVVLLATSFWTSLRRDDLSRTCATIHLFACIAIIYAGVSLGSPQNGYRAIILIEWAISLACVRVMAGSRLTPGTLAGSGESRNRRAPYAVSVRGRALAGRGGLLSGKPLGAETHG